MPVQLSGSLLMSGSITATGLISAQGGISSVGAQQITDLSNPISFTSTASLYTDGGIRVTKDMFVSGTAYFNNVTIYGTQSVEYITSSQLNIGTNIITVNTDTPTVRYGGLAVYDSGSTGLTGSLLWDSEANHWIYTNPSGSTYSGGMMISGPRASARGCEQGTTSCALMVGQGGDHITSSGIFHYGNATCFYSNATVTSTGVGCFAGTICAPNITSTGTVCTTMANASCVGIGTMTPTYTLDVNGTARISSANSELNLISTGASNTANFSVQAGEGAAAIITLKADDGDNAADITTLKQVDQGPFTINVNNDGVTALAINSSGISCFACQVCAPSFISSGTICSTGNVCFGGAATIACNLSVGNTSACSSITITGVTVGGFTSGYIGWGSGTLVTPGIYISSPGTNVEIVTGFNERVALSTGTGLEIFTNDGGGNYTSRLLLNRSGNLGIGASPTTALSISRPNVSGLDADMPAIFVKNTCSSQGNGSTSFNQSGLTLSSGNGAVNTTLRSSYDSGGPYGTGVDLFVTSDHYLRFGTCNSERIRLLANGITCFACQACSPSFIGVSATANNGSPNAIVAYSGNDCSAIWKGAISIVHNTDVVISAGSSIGITLNPLSSTGSSFYGTAAIKAVRENATANNQDTALAFWTRSGASNSTTDTEKMRITSAGVTCFASTVCAPMLLASNCVGIGLTSPQAILDVSHTAGTTNIIRVSNGSGNYRWRVDQNFSMIMTNASNTDTFSVTTAGNIFTAGTSYLTGQMCSQGGIHIGGDLTSSGDEATLTLKQGSTTPTSGLYIERSAEQKGYYIYISGANDSLTFQRNNSGTKSDVLALSRDTIACFSNNVCVGGVLVVNGNTINVNCDTTTATDARINLYTRNSVNGDRASIYTYNLSATTGGCELTYLAFGYCCTNNQGYINMQTKSGGAWCNTMYLINGRVGIGTNAPNYKLEVNGTSCFAGNVAIGGTYCAFALNVHGVTYQIGGSTWVQNGYGYVNAGATTTGLFPLSDNTIQLKIANSAALTINASNNVGIGTTDPQKPLEIRTGGSNTTPSQMFNGAIVQAIVAGEPMIAFSSNISPSLGIPTASELARAGIGFTYVSAAQPSEFSIGIQCTNVCNSNVRFFNGCERMRITGGGCVIVNGTSASSIMTIYPAAGSSDTLTYRTTGNSAAGALYAYSDGNGPSSGILHNVSITSGGGANRFNGSFSGWTVAFDSRPASDAMTFNYVDTSGTYITRISLAGNGITCFSCQVCAPAAIITGCLGLNCTSPGQLLTVNGASSFKCHQQHPAGQWYKIPFYIDKNEGTGTATTKCLVVINNNDTFQELHFTIEYGSRLQGVSDSYTQTSLRSYGVNRFNNGTIAVNDTYLITGVSGCNINTYAPMTVATVGTCMTVVKVDFSCSLGASSFVWGEVRIFSIEPLAGKITISNNSY